MNKRIYCAILLLAGLLAGSGAGCGKKTSAKPGAVDAAPKAAEPNAVSKPSEADDVMAAIEKKDYDGAVAALLRVRQAVRTDEQQIQFVTLAWQAKSKLGEVAATDAKAAEALTTIRTMTAGR